MLFRSILLSIDIKIESVVSHLIGFIFRVLGYKDTAVCPLFLAWFSDVLCLIFAFVSHALGDITYSTSDSFCWTLVVCVDVICRVGTFFHRIGGSVWDRRL